MNIGKTRTNQPVESDDKGIVSVVNNAIEKGDIVAGGTQLYQHEFLLSNEEGEGTQYSVTLISTNKNPIRSMYDFFNGFIRGDVSGDVILGYDGGSLWYIHNGSITSDYIIDPIYSDDEITKL